MSCFFKDDSVMTDDKVAAPKSQRLTGLRHVPDDAFAKLRAFVLVLKMLIWW